MEPEAREERLSPEGATSAMHPDGPACGVGSPLLHGDAAHLMTVQHPFPFSRSTKCFQKTKGASIDSETHF